MPAEQKSIAIACAAPSTGLGTSPGNKWLRNTLLELGKLALSRQVSLTAECLLVMAEDLADIPWPVLEKVITGWRRGSLRMGRPEQMDRFPTVRQLRLQSELLRLEEGNDV